MNVTGKYILNTAGEPVPEPDLFIWAAWIHAADQQIAESMFGDIRVSTVFLGLDHSFSFDETEKTAPILFETMVFGGKLDQEMDRYATREEALLGHAAMNERVRASLQGSGDPP